MKLSIVVFSALLALTAPSASFAQSKADEEAAADGLVRVKVNGLQSVYKHPDADLSRYTKVMLDPIAVSFSKAWEKQSGPRAPTAEEKKAIREGLERVLREEFTREIAGSGRYQVVEAPAPDVLRIKAEIRDLYINAPDLPRAGVSRSYTRSTGEMTLVAELRDAPSGSLLARITDRKRDPEKAWMELTTQVDNVAAAKRAATDWARILRAQLDVAHALEKKDRDR